MKIFDIHFLNPEYFLIIIIIPFFLYFFLKKDKNNPIFSGFYDLKSIYKTNSFLYYFRIILIISIIFTFSLILSNPNLENISEKEQKKGIDIVLAFDVSDSMNAWDLTPTRLEAAKTLIWKFLEKQKTNRVWLVIFSWKPFVWIPLTFDYWILQESIKSIKSDIINQQKLWWTAVWDAILMAKNMFEKEEKSREKVIVLLTDWEANVWVDPKIAAISAKEKNIKIYSIWIWWEKETFINFKVWPFEQKAIIPPLNDKSLREISDLTKAKFYRASDNKTFENIFSELEKLEKTEIESEIKKSYKEIYDYFAYFLSFLIFLLILSFIFSVNFFTKK